MTDLELAEALHRGAVDETIDPDLERQLSFESGLSLKEIQLAALKEGLTPQRFERNMGTLGREGQIKLLRSTVAVAGCGGLGGLIIDLLARSGVGMMHIADGDTFAPSNLNRQILSSEEHLGKEKAATAAERVRSINEALEVRLFGGYLDEKSIAPFLEEVDVAVDALDNNRSRRLLLKGCRERGIPLVHGAIGGFWGQIQVIRSGERALFEEETSDRGIEKETGNPPFTPAVIASLEVTETVKILAGLPSLPGGVMLWIDLERLEFRRLKLY
ncbi:MAG: HesA/MoeB/ThiF family protein [Synergistales bacterium]|jgi:molybdopterin/thiamine biosynthesis adenylyltransferase|nr:HesA/MoeB/ThiF family protein [Synergistales bacterium]